MIIGMKDSFYIDTMYNEDITKLVIIIYNLVYQRYKETMKTMIS